MSLQFKLSALEIIPIGSLSALLFWAVSGHSVSHPRGRQRIIRRLVFITFATMAFFAGYVFFTSRPAAILTNNKPQPRPPVQTLPLPGTKTIKWPNRNESSNPMSNEMRIVIERSGIYRAVVTSSGAALASYELLIPQYSTRDLKMLVQRSADVKPAVERRLADGPINLITSHRPALQARFPDSGFSVPDAPAYSLSADEILADQSRKLVFAWQSDAVRLTRTLTFAPDSYQITLLTEVENCTGLPLSYHFEIGVEGFQDPMQRLGLFSPRLLSNEVLWDVAGSMHHLGFDALQQPQATDRLRGNLRWIGIAQPYFILAVALPHGELLGDKNGHVSAQSNGEMSIYVQYSEQILAPGGRARHPITAYVGPKLPELLAAVKVGSESAGLSNSIDYTFKILVRPLRWMLKGIQNIVRNWVLAVIILTILLQLALLYPTSKARRSTEVLTSLRPEIELMKGRWGSNRQGFNKALSNFYKSRGIKPLNGFFPLLIQMPIFFALYSMLHNAVELYRVQFIWIPDLTAPDPYFILPFAITVISFIHAVRTNAGSSGAHTLIMPLLFGIFSIFIPAGLSLYILTQTIFSLLPSLPILTD